MKKYNSFIDEAPYWKVFVVGFVFSFLLVFAFYHILIGMANLEGTPFANNYVTAKIGCAMGLVMGLMFMLTVGMMRRSARFWKFAQAFEIKIKTTDTLEDVKTLYGDEFDQLKNFAEGSIHYQEVKRLQSMLSIKIDTLTKK